MTWVIADKKTKKPIWKSTDKEYLTRMLKELKANLGNKYYLKEYEERK